MNITRFSDGHWQYTTDLLFLTFFFFINCQNIKCPWTLTWSIYDILFSINKTTFAVTFPIVHIKHHSVTSQVPGLLAAYVVINEFLIFKILYTVFFLTWNMVTNFNYVIIYIFYQWHTLHYLFKKIKLKLCSSFESTLFKSQTPPCLLWKPFWGLSHNNHTSDSPRVPHSTPMSKGSTVL